MPNILAIIYISMLPILCLFQPSQPVLDNCKLHIQDSTYSLSLLSTPDSWTVREQNADSGLFSMQYMFNFCKQVAQPCKGESVPAFEVLAVMGQVTDTCEIIGRDKDITAKFIDDRSKNKGFKVTYGSGDICQNSENPIENGQPRKVNYKVTCSQKQDSNWQFTPINSRDVTKCNLEFTINSPAGCLPGTSSSGSSSKKLSFFIIIMLLCYFGGGIFYNSKVNNLQGKDALPHKEFWLDSPQLAIEGARFLIAKANLIKEKLQGKETKGGYNTL